MRTTSATAARGRGVPPVRAAGRLPVFWLAEVRFAGAMTRGRMRGEVAAAVRFPAARPCVCPARRGASPTMIRAVVCSPPERLSRVVGYAVG